MVESKQGKETGLIFDIQRFSIHDGPGIRTLIFFKGCPLRCQWCANPEGQLGKKELFFHRRRCIRCHNCVTVCPHGASLLSGSNVVVNRKSCILCGKCVEICPTGARMISGKYMSISQVMEIIERDEVFFRHSGGGITLGGGEPTYQPDFVHSLLAECKRNYLHTAIETCGDMAWETFSIMLDKTDLVLYDMKHIDEEKHIKYTGVSNKKILENLDRLIRMNQDVVVRITLIPGFNDSENDKKRMVDFVKTKRSDIKIEYLSYHKFSLYKYESLGRAYSYFS